MNNVKGWTISTDERGAVARHDPSDASVRIEQDVVVVDIRPPAVNIRIPWVVLRRLRQGS